MITHLQHVNHTAGLLAYRWSPGERGDPSNPRLVGGGCHGAPADTRWAEVTRSGITVVPDGDADAYRWIALHNRPHQVPAVATLVREDENRENTYQDAFHLQGDFRRIAVELGHLPASPVTQPPVPENWMPITVTITAEPSGSVVARGGDGLATSLLTHAGFAYVRDWHGPRHRLPTSMDRAEQAAVASHAAEMLRTARYTVELDPVLGVAHTNSSRGQSLSDQVLLLTDRIRGAESGAELADALVPLLHPEHGVLERVREALEAAGEQAVDLDAEAYQVGDRFGFAAEFITAAQGELVSADDELRRVAVPEHGHVEGRSDAVQDARDAALSTSPAAAQGSVVHSPAPSATAAVPGPARTSAPPSR